MDEKFIGTFELTNESVIISDPCYKKGTWCQGKLEKVKTGTWNTVVIEEDDEGLIAELIVYHDKIDKISDLDGKWDEQPFNIGVDSGQAGFFQEDKYRNDSTSLDLPVYFMDEEEKEEGERWYGVCCNITLSKMQAGVLEGGAVSSTGYGDGGYALYTVEQDNEIVAMKIIFIEEDNDDEYDDEFEED